MAKKDLVRVIDNNKKVQNATSFFTAGSGGGTVDTSNFLLLDGTRAMLASLDMGGFSITNVNLLDGVDLATHVTLPDAHHATATPRGVDGRYRFLHKRHCGSNARRQLAKAIGRHTSCTTFSEMV